LRKRVKISIIAQFIDRFSAQMVLFDAICAGYFWIFFEIKVKMMSCAAYLSNPAQFPHLLDAFQCDCDLA
jgi:hypothetical protein